MLEGSTISSMIYPTLRINYCLLLLIRGLQSPGPGFFEPFPAYQTLPDTLFFSFPALADRCYCGLPPSAPRWGQVPGVVRRLKFPFDCCSDETDVRVRIRGIVVRIRHRNTAIRVRVVVATIDHTAYGEAPPFKCKSTIFKLLFNKQIQNLTSKNIFRRADARNERRSPARGTPGRFVASLPL